VRRVRIIKGAFPTFPRSTRQVGDSGGLGNGTVVSVATEPRTHDQTAPLAGIVFGNVTSLPARPPLAGLRGWKRFERHVRRAVANAVAGGFLVPKRLRNVLLRE